MHVYVYVTTSEPLHPWCLLLY